MEAITLPRPTAHARRVTASAAIRIERRYLEAAAVLVAVAGITAVDSMSPAGIVVGIMLCAPVLLTSMSDDTRLVWLAMGASLLGLWIASEFGPAPTVPGEFWYPNRLFTLAAIPGSGGIALILQRGRRSAERSRDEAVSASDLNHLLMSLLAHDLRAPLSLASQGFEYVDRTLEHGGAPDRELLGDTRARLQRSLRAIDLVLSVARDEVAPDAASGARRGGASDVRREIEAEVASFADEAAVRGKTLRISASGLASALCPVNGLVLRQVLTILVDNAVRYADPGPIRVEAALQPSGITMRVADCGPGISAHRSRNPSSDGSGLGLELCRALAARAGGSLEIERDGPEGTVFALRLPSRPVA